MGRKERRECGGSLIRDLAQMGDTDSGITLSQHGHSRMVLSPVS